jgi:hypothetical protein
MFSASVFFSGLGFIYISASFSCQLKAVISGADLRIHHHVLECEKQPLPTHH